MGFLPFYSGLDMSLYFFGAYLGDTHGLELAAIDWLVFSLRFAYPRATGRLPYRFPLAFYLLVVVASATQAQWPWLSLGYAWKLCRMYLVFAVVWRAGEDRQAPRAILDGLMLGLLYEGVLTAWQHWGLGLFQATGSFTHQNTLAVLLNLVALTPLALVFGGRTSLLAKLTPVAAFVAALFTVSRGALLFLGAGSALVFLGSTLSRFTVRKAWIGVLGLVLAAAIVPLALGTLQSRSAADRAGSMEHRNRLERAASLMLQDHPLGIGPNSFTPQLLFAGYADRAGLPWGQRVAIVHNVYSLTAAEMGYPGLVALVLLFLAPLVSTLRHALRARHERRGDLLLGLGVGLMVFYMHCFFEWAWRLTEVSYVYFVTIAIGAVVARQFDDDVMAARRRTAPFGVRRAGAATSATRPPRDRVPARVPNGLPV